MEIEILLSRELMRYARELETDYYEDFLPPEEREDARLKQRLEINVTRLIVLCREKLILNSSDLMNEIVTENREIVERWLDEYYSLLQLESISDLVRRTLRLSALTATDTPSSQTNLYISEANRAYIYGFHQSSAAMSRAALEQGLKERLGRQGDGQIVSLRGLIFEAKKCNLLSITGLSAAQGVAEEANHVLHEGPTNDEESAFQTLFVVRSLLEEVFSAEGHY